MGIGRPMPCHLHFGGTFPFTMTTDWWEAMTAPERADAPIRDLVDGLDDIGAQPIPYGRLPTRAHTVYSADLTTWTDLAGETITSLLNRPKGGVATVRAVIACAQDAVAKARAVPSTGSSDAASAAAQLLNRLTEHDRTILSARLWAIQPQTSEEVGRALGASGASVLRRQPKVERRFAELLADPAHRDVLAHAKQLNRLLGPLVREQTINTTLRDLGIHPSSQAALLLLHVAGPYARRKDWLEDTSADGLATASATLEAALARLGAPTTAALVEELGHIGMRPDSVVDFVESRQGLRRFGDKWVRWGTSAADKAEAVLHVSETPASADLITAAIGENYHPRAVREALFGDHRFARATRRTWALRQWGLDEYAGVFGEIAKRIDAAGGTTSVAAVVSDMKARFPDIAEVSVRTYLAAPGFIVEDGLVRRRTADDGWPPVPPLHAARGAFRNGDNEIRVSFAVTSDLMRGSGQPIHAAVATALGMNPGDQRVFTGSLGDITLAWRLSSTHGPSVGSLRPFAAALGASRDDTLVLAFTVRGNALAAQRIKLGEAPRTRLQTLLGIPVRDTIAALAQGLCCKPREVAQILRDRGDNELLELVEQDLRSAGL